MADFSARSPADTSVLSRRLSIAQATTLRRQRNRQLRFFDTQFQLKSHRSLRIYYSLMIIIVTALQSLLRLVFINKNKKIRMEFTWKHIQHSGGSV